MPSHCLRLKVGMPIMLTRNLNPTQGHCNGTRYIVKHLSQRVILAEISIGPYKGNDEAYHFRHILELLKLTAITIPGNTLMIPRIKFIPTDRTLPIEMERRQYPIRICMAITSNRSQG